VSFFPNELDPQDGRTARDLGLALAYLERQPGPFRQQMIAHALPLLEQGVQALPDDVPAREALGWVLALLGRNAEAMASFDTVLARVPERELTLALASALAESAGQGETAIDYLRRLTVVNPWMWEYRFNLARLLAQRGDWSAALQECDAALGLSPAHIPTRALLITACLHAGDRSRAEREFTKLLALNPQEARRWRAWYADLLKAK
jgi:tetratricopeptide (TPR) repeat protein